MLKDEDQGQRLANILAKKVGPDVNWLDNRLIGKVAGISKATAFKFGSPPHVNSALPQEGPSDPNPPIGTDLPCIGNQDLKNNKRRKRCMIYQADAAIQ
jgi:hypothetical protein